MSKLVVFGVRQLFGGARRGQPGIAGLGAAMAIIGWMRGRSRANELLFKRRLKPGQEIRIKFLKGDGGAGTADELSVTG